MIRLFLFKIVNELVCSPPVISQINLNAPKRAIRHTSLFRPLDYTSRFVVTDPMNRLCNLANLYCEDVDFFTDVLLLLRRTSLER